MKGLHCKLQVKKSRCSRQNAKNALPKTRSKYQNRSTKIDLPNRSTSWPKISGLTMQFSTSQSNIHPSIAGKILPCVFLSKAQGQELKRNALQQTQERRLKPISIY